MNKIERVRAVVDGRRPDRPPVSFWYHFGHAKVAGPAAVEAHVQHIETYDLDLLKIMDDNGYPRSALPSGVIRDTEDLERLEVLRGDEDTFGLQLELIDQLVSRYSGQLPMATTIFNSWNVLRSMTAPDPVTHAPPSYTVSANPRDAAMTRLLHEAPAAVERALGVISETLANFASQAIAAGIDGVFLSLRDDRVDSPENGEGVYDRLVRPGDLQILAGARQGSLNLLHVCGKPIDFDRFIDYPVQMINWADRQAGPAIADVFDRMGPAICAGVDNIDTLSSGSPADCRQEVADALKQAHDRPIMIAPGCTFNPDTVPAENLHAVRQAVETR